MAGCATRSVSAQHSEARGSGDLECLVAALDTMRGSLESISEGSAQMMQFTYVPEIVDPLIAANEAAVPMLVACLSRSQPSRVRGPDGRLVPVGVVCAQVLYSTAFFQQRLTSNRWPDSFRDSTELGYSPTSAELERAQQAWRAYLTETTPE
jgi:hypothetical protein